MSKKLAVTVSLLTVLCISMFAPVLVHAASPGVQEGEYFTYSIKTNWETTNSSRTVPEYLLETNKTQHYNVIVSYVSGANVTATNTWQYVNGTTGNTRVDMEVDNGEVISYIPGHPAFLGFYPANLSTNDPIRPLNPTGLWVNETVSREYAGRNREVNVVRFSYEVTDYYNSSFGEESVTYYIDKETGVLVEQTAYTEFPDENGSITWVLTATNAWKDANAPLSLSMFEIAAIVAVIAILIAVVVLLLKRRRT